MDKIYVIFGATGEYSDRSEWPITAVQSEDRAKEIVKEIEAAFKARWAPLILTNERFWKDRKTAFPPGWNPYDPNEGAPDYTGSYYWYTEVAIST